MKEDWSGRHVRLRFELFVTALLISTFVFYDAKLRPSILLDLSADTIPSIHILVALYLFYGYTLVSFILRTQIERISVTDEQAEVERTLKSILDTREAMRQTLVPLETRHLVAQFHELKIKIEQLSDSYEGNSGAMNHCEMLRARLSKMRTATPDPNTTRMDEAGMRLQEIKMVEGDLRSAEDTVIQRRTSADRAAEEILRDVSQKVSDLAALIEHGAPRAFAEANAKLGIDLGGFEKIRRNFALAVNAFSWDRMWVSCFVPAGVSTALVVSSLAWHVFKP